MKYIKKLKKHPLKSWVKGYGKIAMRDFKWIIFNITIHA